MSNAAVLFYQDVKKLCDAAGDYTQFRALYYDLINGTQHASPESVKVLSKYFDGSFYKLEDHYKEVTANAIKKVLAVRGALASLGLYDKADEGNFINHLRRCQDDCDFRTMVRGWCNQAIHKAEKGKEVSIISYGEFLARYDALLLKRRKKNSDD